MKRSLNNYLKLTVVALALSLIIATLLNGTGRKTEAAGTQGQVAAVAADPTVNDLTLNPPRVESMTTTPLADRSVIGNAVLMVRFAPDGRLGKQIKTIIDDREVVLTDDGTGGDATAGDGTYSAIIMLDFADLANNQDRVQSVNAQPDPAAMPFEFAPSDTARAATQAPDEAAAGNAANDDTARVVTVDSFDGRSQSGARQAPLVDFRNVRPGQIVPLNPIGTWRAVDPERSLMIRDVRVVEDPARTFNPCTRTGTPMGRWTFGYLMTQMANTPRTGIPASTFVRKWLDHWMSNQTINGFTAKQRQQIKQLVIDPWEQASGGPGAPLDLSIAPFKLLAIVNRVDLRTNTVYGGGSAGEGRFVFGVMDMRPCNGCPIDPYTGRPRSTCSPTQFTVILEYGIERTGCAVRDWGRQWYNLQNYLLGTPAYNAALQAITDQFTRANAAPHKPNGSAINQVRTNEVALVTVCPDCDWQMREFRIAPNSTNNGPLNETVVVRTPDNSRNFTDVPLSHFVNANLLGIFSDTYTVPLTWLGTNFQGNASDVPFGIYWDGPDAGGSIPNRQARHLFSLNTCNSCHQRETDTIFTHVKPAAFGTRADLSAFLTGCVPGSSPCTPAPAVVDPADGAPSRKFNDLKRRAIDLDTLVNSPCFFDIRFVPMLMTH